MFPCRMVLKIVLLSSSLSYSPWPKLRISLHTSLKVLVELMNVSSYGAIIRTIFFCPEGLFLSWNLVVAAQFLVF